MTASSRSQSRTSAPRTRATRNIKKQTLRKAPRVPVRLPLLEEPWNSDVLQIG